MNKKMILLAIVTLAAVSLACTININLPSTQAKTGPPVTETIQVPLLTDPQAVPAIPLAFGAGDLTLQPGAKDALVDGTATYNVTDFKPTVSIENDDIRIEQGNLELNGLPTFKNDVINDWKLNLGTSPMSLVIKAGAYNGNFELGGLSIQRLDVTDGAAKVNVSFSKPNLVEMSSLLYTTGASEVTMTGLSNANITDMTFGSGAGSYTLDFSGELRNNMNVTIESGMSTVTVIVPEGMNVQVNAASGLMTISTRGNWEQHGDIYQLGGTGNTITINVKMGAGNLKLETGTSGNN